MIIKKIDDFYELSLCDTCKYREEEVSKQPCCICFDSSEYEPIKGDDEE